jgi:hypothetical protein
MREKLFILALASIQIAGCAGHSVECALGTGHTDCATGTAGHEVNKLEQQAGKSVAAIDDAKCRAYANPGSTAYGQCRAEFRRQRSE